MGGPATQHPPEPLNHIELRTLTRQPIVHFFDDVKDTPLRRDVSPVALEAGLVKGRAIGHDHLDIEPSIFESLEKRVHVGLLIFIDYVERYRTVLDRIGGKQNRVTTIVD